MIFDIKENRVISQEGGNAEIDPYVLEKWGENLNDPKKISTHCKDKRGIIDYETAKRRFETYYDKLNKTDSGKMRGKMFDKKYNKKNRLLLYPGLPCSEKYLEEDGPSKYDMWGVDAFPEGNEVIVNSKDNVITHYYNPKEKYSDDLKYGPEITYTHLLNQYGEDGTKEFLEKDYQNKLFNRYFKDIKPPKWPQKTEKGKKIEKPIIVDEDSTQFDESIQRKRDKRSKKQTYQPMNIKYPLKKETSKKIEIFEEPIINEIPNEEILEEKYKGISAVELFKQPIINSKAPRSSSIENFEDFDYLVYNYSLDNMKTLYNNRTKFLYEIPMKEEYIDDELLFEKYKIEIFDMIDKPLMAIGKMTMNGPELFN